MIYYINVKIKGKVPQVLPMLTALIFWCICPCYGYAKIPYANSPYALIPYALIPYAEIPFADFPVCRNSNCRDFSCPGTTQCRILASGLLFREDLKFQDSRKQNIHQRTTGQNLQKIICIEVFYLL